MHQLVDTSSSTEIDRTGGGGNIDMSVGSTTNQTGRESEHQKENASTTTMAPHAHGNQPLHSTTSSVTAATTVTTKRIVRTGRVNCRWLYNQVQASRGMILIDARSRAAFDEDTIPSAISLPPPTSTYTTTRSLEDLEVTMLEEQRHLFTAKKRKLRDVVLFGDTVKHNSQSPTNDHEGSHTSTSWLAQLEQLIVADGLVTSVKVLSDGFLTFKYRYPFFTTAAMLENLALGLERTQSGTHNLNYPNEVLDGFLFLGNMWHAQSQQVIRHLGITHVVNASLDIENVFANDGVRYHEVKIKDRPDADIASYFDSTYAFIESAKRTQHGRVLVHCTQGISRSATLVIMYLMRAHQWSLVTATNFALASRGVVYPNQGFMKALMEEELMLYKGNSLTEDEIDTLLQHQIPDRPIPLRTQDVKSESCTNCRKLFGLLEWKHRCSYCRKEFCSKCTSTRLAMPEREKDSSPGDEYRKARRVCNCCVSRLWKIKLPRPRKGIQLRFPRLKHLNVNSMSTFGKPVCVSFYEGTDSQTILDVIKTRFEVQSNQIIDISTECGEAVHDLASLPSDSVVLISIGKAGNVQDIPHRSRSTNTYGRRYQILKEQRALNNAQRVRFSSEGNVDALMMDKSERLEFRRSDSFHLESSSDRLPEPPIEPEPQVVEEKFRELWTLSFPTMGMIDREELLKVENPMILTDLMLGVSALACGTMKLRDFAARLKELGYSEKDQDLVLKKLTQSYHS